MDIWVWEQHVLGQEQEHRRVEKEERKPATEIRTQRERALSAHIFWMNFIFHWSIQTMTSQHVDSILLVPHIQILHAMYVEDMSQIFPIKLSSSEKLADLWEVDILPRLRAKSLSALFRHWKSYKTENLYYFVCRLTVDLLLLNNHPIDTQSANIFI